MDAQIVEDVAHSSLGASGAHRWMNCAGSVQLTDTMVSGLNAADLDAFERGGAAASEGTAAHTIAAKALEAEKDAWEFIGHKLIVDGREFEVDQEMADGIQVHLNLVRELMEKYADQGARLYVEESMSSVLDEQAFGTADAIIYVPGVIIIVIDFKYGQGIVVEPDSDQNHYYGYLAFENFETDGIEDIELWITQPRIPHPKGPVRSYRTTRKAVEEWFTCEVLPAMEATRDPKANLTIGDWCRFCPARDVCPALRSEVMNFDMTLEPAYMTGDELGTLLQRGDAIRRYLSNLEGEAYKRARKGEDVSGYKLVRKKANRTFRDSITLKEKDEDGKEVEVEVKLEDALPAQFGDEAYQPRALKTPPNIEKLNGGKKFVSRWAFTPDTGLTLAPDSDKREAVKLTGEEFFGDESDI